MGLCSREHRVALYSTLTTSPSSALLPIPIPCAFPPPPSHRVLFFLYRSASCSVCYLQHTSARCVTSLSRAFTYNLIAYVSGMASNMLPYSYVDISSNAPPSVLAVVVNTTASPSNLTTLGGDTVVIYGEVPMWFPKGAGVGGTLQDPCT